MALQGSVYAQATSDITDARTYYQKGLSAYALEHFSEAADDYEKAFSLKADPALLYNAAQAHRLAGNYDRALHLYQSYLRIFGKRASNRDEVERHINELQLAVNTQKKAQTSPPTGVSEPDSGGATTATKPATDEVKGSPPGGEGSSTGNTSVPPPEATSTTTSTLVVAPVPVDKPIYKKGWFWGVVAGAVVVVGVGVGLGVGLSSGGSKNPTGSFGTTTVN